MVFQIVDYNDCECVNLIPKDSNKNKYRPVSIYITFVLYLKNNKIKHKFDFLFRYPIVNLVHQLHFKNDSGQYFLVTN